MQVSFQLSRYFLLVVTVVMSFIRTSKGTPKVIDARGKGVSRDEHSGISFANFKAHKFSYLNITSLTTDYVLNGRECGLACVNIPPCFSFNLASFYDITGKILCELLPSDKYNNSDKFVTSKLFHHFSIRSPCMNEPCLNNGTCISLYKKNSFACVCNRGYTGRNCKTDIDECVIGEHDCHSSASCTNTAGSYSCSCNQPYFGDGKMCNLPQEFVEAKVTSSCANLLVVSSKTSGIIRSGQYGHYGNNMNCQWNLTSNVKLELVFLHFATESSTDYVNVYDGGSLTSPLLSTFSGSALPAPIMSSSNKLYVTFTTDGSGTRYGFTATYRAVTTGTARLNGSTSSTGRVEIFHNDQWGTICDHGWDMNDANVVCRQLGFPQAIQAYTGATHGQGTGPIWMDDVACSGSESHITDCSHRGWGNHDCTHSRDVSVQCSYPGSAVIRLVNGGASYGRVEVYYNGKWGTVCDDDWDILDANVVCRQLGFSSASSAPHNAAYGQGSDPIWMENIVCHGGEASLLDCTHTGWGMHNCNHGEDASVVCNT